MAWRPSEEEQAGMTDQQRQAVSEVTDVCMSYPIVLARGMHLRTERADANFITHE